MQQFSKYKPHRTCKLFSLLLFVVLTNIGVSGQNNTKIDPKKLYPKKNSEESKEAQKNTLIKQYLNIIDSLDNNTPRKLPEPVEEKQQKEFSTEKETSSKHVNHIFFSNSAMFSVQIEDELLERINKVQYKKQGQLRLKKKPLRYDTLKLKNSWLLVGFKEKISERSRFNDRNLLSQEEKYLQLLFPNYDAETPFITRKEVEKTPDIPLAFDELKTYAEQYIGTPYRGGAVGPNAFDCSGFTRHIYQNFGLSLPHSSGSQSSLGMAIDKEQVRPGDLLFFKGRNRNSSRVGHVGIVSEVLPDGTVKMIHASTSRGVMIDKPFEADYYKNRFLSARRILER